ncbi:hypothetical protein M135_1065 [Bacteroides fragilis str. S36L5]|uniref:Uncharacterized protein n=1 Tax=Bacteroides fragilis str. S36L11 TaxID=1339327 RepID=A0A015Z511_BACFG|nr:hypothetical protein M136_0883 [Bacteroides fragilis str. S36L11]EXZ79731.1 hypothetical protein M144_0941 [Bacteroides fragilis str. 3-F-2 \
MSRYLLLRYKYDVIINLILENVFCCKIIEVKYQQNFAFSIFELLLFSFCLD